MLIDRTHEITSNSVIDIYDDDFNYDRTRDNVRLMFDDCNNDYYMIIIRNRVIYSSLCFVAL